MRFIIILLTVLSSLYSVAQNNLKIIDCKSNEYLQNVFLHNSNFVTCTNIEGEAIIPKGIDSLTISHVSYDSRKILITSDSLICIDKKIEVMPEIVITALSSETRLKNAITDLRENFDYQVKQWGTFYLNGVSDEADFIFVININSLKNKGNYNLLKGKVHIKKEKEPIFPFMGFHYAFYYHDVYIPSNKFYKEKSFKKYTNLKSIITDSNETAFTFTYKNVPHKITLDKNDKIYRVETISNHNNIVEFSLAESGYTISYFEYNTNGSTYKLYELKPKIKNSKNKFRGTERLEKLIFDPF